MIRGTTVSKILVLLLGLQLQLANTKDYNLELVQVIFRHGERTPRAEELYPNDPYPLSTYDPWGLGQLTNKGKMTEYRIGRMLRERYASFLGDMYYPSDIYAASTDVDRTKMSLQLVLAGLYPPGAIQTWNALIPWMPIPAHYAPEIIDNVMKPTNCPTYIEERQNVRNSKEIRNKNFMYRDLLKYLAVKTGANITDTFGAVLVYYALVSQKAMHLTPPEWCTEDVYKKLEEIAELEWDIASYNTKMKRLNGGMLIKKFLKNMDANEKRKRPRKIYLYSAHDENVSAFAKAHNFSEPKIPPFGSAFIFEKLRSKTDKVYVRILYWSGTTGQLIPIDCDKYGMNCPINKYLKYVQDVLPTDEETHCLLNNISHEELRTMYDEN